MIEQMLNTGFAEGMPVINKVLSKYPVPVESHNSPVNYSLDIASAMSAMR